MFQRISVLVFACVCLMLGGSASAYEFWGIEMSTALYDGADNLTFTGVADAGVSYVVGGYKYTKVDSEWLGAFAAASPGTGFMSASKSDAQGLFLKVGPDTAKFMIITSANQNGSTMPDVATGAREFGPGDLKLNAGNNTYGVGLRISGLDWALPDSPFSPEYQIHGALGGVDSINARDNGNLGDVRLDPQWDWMGHSTLVAGSDESFAFYVAGTGKHVGDANVSFESTGIRLNGALVYAYQVEVPWSTIGMSATSFDFTASWRPDCGNDILETSFNSDPAMTPAVPEPSALAVISTGLASLGLVIRKRM